jgi:hypothetical protein
MPGTCGGTLIANPTINRAVVNALGCFLRSNSDKKPVSEGAKPAKTTRLAGIFAVVACLQHSMAYTIGQA